MPSRPRSDLPACERCGEPAALSPAIQRRELGEIRRRLAAAAKEPHRTAVRIIKLQQAAEPLQLLLERERHGLCTSCARVSLERNRSFGRQVVATAIGTALGTELHKVFFGSPLKPAAAPKDDHDPGSPRGGRA